MRSTLIVVTGLLLPAMALSGSTTGSLTVHVFDHQGQRLPGAEVTVQRGELCLPGLTNADGQAAFPSLPAGRGYTVTVEARTRFMPHHSNVRVVGDGEVHLGVRAEKTTRGPQNLDPLTGSELPPVRPCAIEEMEVITAGSPVAFGPKVACRTPGSGWGRVEVTVLGPDGKPVRGAAVYAVATVAPRCANRLQRTDAEGIARFNELEAGMSYALDVRGGLLWSEDRIDVADGAEVRRTVRLEMPAGSVIVAVVDRDGEVLPATSARLAARRSERGWVPLWDRRAAPRSLRDEILPPLYYEVRLPASGPPRPEIWLGRQ